jgi:hypothetical protein
MKNPKTQQVPIAIFADDVLTIERFIKTRSRELDSSVALQLGTF